jgi:hypothetical protein
MPVADSSSLTPDYGICLISASGFVMWALSMTAAAEATIERAELKALSKANEALRTAQNLPAGAERIAALKLAGVLRNRAILIELIQPHIASERPIAQGFLS